MADETKNNINFSQSFKPTKTTTTIQALKYSCLRKISQYLDFKTQSYFLNYLKLCSDSIIKEILKPHKSSTLDLSQFVNMPIKDIQAEFLECVLKCFSKIENVPPKMFKACMQKTKAQEFSNVKYLSIQGADSYSFKNNAINSKDFQKFPSLEEFHLTSVKINHNSEGQSVFTKNLQISNVSVLKNMEEEFLKSVFSSQLEKIKINFKPNARVTYKAFADIGKCVQLREVKLKAEYLYFRLETMHRYYYNEILTSLVRLPALEILDVYPRYDPIFFPADCDTIYMLYMLYLVPENSGFTKIQRSLLSSHYCAAPVVHEEKTIPDVLIGPLNKHYRRIVFKKTQWKYLFSRHMLEKENILQNYKSILKQSYKEWKLSNCRNHDLKTAFHFEKINCLTLYGLEGFVKRERNK